jgi:hypothetical protein
MKDWIKILIPIFGCFAYNEFADKLIKSNITLTGGVIAIVGFYLYHILMIAIFVWLIFS